MVSVLRCLYGLVTILLLSVGIVKGRGLLYTHGQWRKLTTFTFRNMLPSGFESELGSKQLS